MLTITEKKAYLESPKALQKEIALLQLKLVRLKDRSVNVSPTQSSDPVRCTKVNDRITDIISDIVDVENKIIDTQFKLDSLLNDISQKISNLPNPDHQMLLHYRYVDNLQFHQIAQNLNFSLSHIYHLHRQSLSSF